MAGSIAAWESCCYRWRPSHCRSDYQSELASFVIRPFQSTDSHATFTSQRSGRCDFCSVRFYCGRGLHQQLKECMQKCICFPVQPTIHTYSSIWKWAPECWLLLVSMWLQPTSSAEHGHLFSAFLCRCSWGVSTLPDGWVGFADAGWCVLLSPSSSARSWERPNSDEEHANKRATYKAALMICK